MPTYHAVYYQDAEGRQPARDALNALPSKTRTTLRNQLDRLNLLGPTLPHLPFPHSSHLAGEIRELRCHRGKDHYRALYAQSETLIVVLHLIAKREERVPPADIELATERLADFRRRMDEQPRQPPRAAGHDIP